MDERVSVKHFREGRGSIPLAPTDWLWREAQASCDLDGETQSLPIPNVLVYRRMPDGSITETREYHPDFPHFHPFTSPYFYHKIYVG
jgi:hypothetical protein